MWQEARRQEKKLRGMMVDYRKRAERRRAFYERMKLDPTQFLRVYGQKCKIHIDPQLAAAGDGKSVMMPWQGDSNNMIDRFDVRAHLDIIPEQPSLSTMGPLMETNPEEHRLNYERYRTLVMIDCSGVSEESYIRQLEVEEMYGVKKDDDKKEKEKSQAKATIGFTYDNASAASSDKDDEDSDSDSDSVLSDIDVTVDVDEIDASQRETLDAQGLHYGMASAQFCRKLKEDKEEIEEQRRLRQEEEERSLVTGRRAKRERRSIREKQRRRAHDLEQSPPSYARKASPTYEPYSRSSSRSSSRSHSPEDAGKVEFITEFSHKDDNPSTKKAGGDSQSHTISSRTSERKKSKERDRSQSHKKHRSRTRSRSRSRSRDRDRRRYRDRSRSRSRDRSRSRNRSRSRDRDRHGGRGQDRYKRSRSRSRSRDRDRKERDSLRVADNKDWRGLPSKALGLLKNKATPSSGSKDKMTTQEKMKKRMQMMLNKQLKTDKKEDRRKRDVKEQERREREDDLREMQRKWRERDRERDRYDRSRSSSPRGRRRSESRSPPRRRHTSRSRSGSPIESQKIPVVDIDARAMGEDVVEYVYPVKKER